MDTIGLLHEVLTAECPKSPQIPDNPTAEPDPMIAFDVSARILVESSRRRPIFGPINPGSRVRGEEFEKWNRSKS
jgi:hypothetical protein